MNLRTALGGLLIALLGFLMELKAQVLESIYLYPTADATISSLDPTANYGNNPDLIALAWSANDREFVLRSLLNFELPELAPGEVLSSASLSLYATTGSTNPGHLGSNDALITRIDQEWLADDINWDNQPGALIDHAVFIPQSEAPDEDVQQLDVTELIREALSDPASFNGLRIQLQSESVFRSVNFASSDHPDPSLHPVLQLDILREGTTGADRALKQPVEVLFGPNPLADVLQIRVNLEQAGDAHVEVFQQSGATFGVFPLGRLAPGQSTQRLSAREWPKGVLMMRLVVVQDGKAGRRNTVSSPMQQLVRR